MNTKIKKLMPEFVLRQARTIRENLFRFTDRHRPYLTSMRYAGFRIFFTRGTGLIDRIRLGSMSKIYESELSEKIVSEIRRLKGSSFCDAGSNIGLISLYVLSQIPDLKIYAFEPGPHQYRLFATTIFANQLEGKIRLENIALSNTRGTLNFHVHIDSRHNSGDGLRDTKRAGSSRSIKVAADTFDSWAHVHDVIPDVIKIDVEGAELLVLQGMRDTLEAHKPVLFLEISKVNLQAYPHTAKDILDFLTTNGYRLYTLDEKTCSGDNFESIIETQDTFIARPL